MPTVAAAVAPRAPASPATSARRDTGPRTFSAASPSASGKFVIPASQFFGYGGGNGNGYYCSSPIDQKMADASHLELTDPAKATTLWTAIDHQLTSNAVWVPTVKEREVEFVSKRLRNYEYNPVWGFLPDQSWLALRLPRPGSMAIL